MKPMGDSTKPTLQDKLRTPMDEPPSRVEFSLHEQIDSSTIDLAEPLGRRLIHHGELGATLDGVSQLDTNSCKLRQPLRVKRAPGNRVAELAALERLLKL